MNKRYHIFWLFLVLFAVGIGSKVNAYTFAGGDPINYFDPDGRLSKPANAFSAQMNSINSALTSDFVTAYNQTERQMQYTLNAGYYGTSYNDSSAAKWSGILDATPLVSSAKLGWEMQTGRDLLTSKWELDSDISKAFGFTLGLAPVLTAPGRTIGAFSSTTALAPVHSRTPLAGPTANWQKYLQAEARISTTPQTLAEIQDAIRLNAGMADVAAAGTARSFGRFGTASHSEFEVLNNQLNRQLTASGSPYNVAVEQFRDGSGAVVGRRAGGSLGVDAVVNFGPIPQIGMDLKTGGTGWSQSKLRLIESRFGVPVVQIKTGR